MSSYYYLLTYTVATSKIYMYCMTGSSERKLLSSYKTLEMYAGGYGSEFEESNGKRKRWAFSLFLNLYKIKSFSFFLFYWNFKSNWIFIFCCSHLSTDFHDVFEELGKKFVKRFCCTTTAKNYENSMIIRSSRNDLRYTL